MSAYFASSRVLLNASIRLCGSFLINPTVSVSRTFSPLGSSILLVVGSSVAKSLSSDNTPASVSLLRSVDLPALVYPTIAATGVKVLALLLLWTSLCSFISLRSAESFDILSLISRLSVSIFFSPGPLVPIPPPSLDIDVPKPASLIERYFNCAIST